MWNARMASSQNAIAATKTRMAGTQSTERRRLDPPPDASRSSCSSSGKRCSPRRRSSSRTCVTSSKNRGSSRVSTVRGEGRSMSTVPAIRPGRGLITTTRVERKTASEIEWVTKTTVDASCCQIASSSRFRRSRVISSSAPNGSSISSSAGSNASARAIADTLLHAARELPRMVVAEVLQLDELEHLLARGPCAARGPSRAARAGVRCSSRTVRHSKSTASWKTMP